MLSGVSEHINYIKKKLQVSRYLNLFSHWNIDFFEELHPFYELKNVIKIDFKFKKMSATLSLKLTAWWIRHK